MGPSELHALRDLELATRATVEGLRPGLHRSPFHGYSAEFAQYRHYRPGDDLKYVDWKLFGRTDRFYTRQFRETTNLAALFVIDVSASMDFAGIGHQASGIGNTKVGLATSIAAILGTLVLDQGDELRGRPLYHGQKRVLQISALAVELEYVPAVHRPYDMATRWRYEEANPYLGRTHQCFLDCR